MSAVPTDIKPMPAAKRFNEVTVKGKIESHRRYEDKHYHRVISPASDAYSRPQVLEIRSDSKLGQRGDEIIVECKLGGYNRKTFRSTDKDGEITMVTPVGMTLDALH